MTAEPLPSGPAGRVSDEEFDTLAKRLKAARALKNKPDRSRLDVELAADEIGIHASTLYRDIKRLEGRGTVEDLAPRGKGWPEGRSKLHPRQDELVEQFLQTKYMTRARPSMISVAAQNRRRL